MRTELCFSTDKCKMYFKHVTIALLCVWCGRLWMRFFCWSVGHIWERPGVQNLANAEES